MALLFFLLPVFGIRGYYASFLITHVINFILSMQRLLAITGEKIDLRFAFAAIFCAAGTLWVCAYADGIAGCGLYALALFAALLLTGTLRRADLHWFRRLFHSTM